MVNLLDFVKFKVLYIFAVCNFLCLAFIFKNSKYRAKSVKRCKMSYFGEKRGLGLFAGFRGFSYKLNFFVR
jgi:hypothetical protein